MASNPHLIRFSVNERDADRSGLSIFVIYRKATEMLIGSTVPMMHVLWKKLYIVINSQSRLARDSSAWQVPGVL